MTSGERMVFAAGFERGIFEGQRPHHAAVNARACVERLRMVDRDKIDDETRAMLDDMLGTGLERPPATRVPVLGGPVTR